MVVTGGGRGIGAAPYAVTKHAALAFAKWMALTYGDRGITVQALCPQGVRTDLLDRADDRIADPDRWLAGMRRLQHRLG